MKVIKFIIGSFAVLIIIGAVIAMIAAGTGSPASTMTVQAAPAPPDPMAAHKLRALQGAAVLRSAVRDPRSFELISVGLMEKSNALCYKFRATNGFGGYVVDYAVETPKGKFFMMADTSDGGGNYSRYCSGKSGTELVKQ